MIESREKSVMVATLKEKIIVKGVSHSQQKTG